LVSFSSTIRLSFMKRYSSSSCTLLSCSTGGFAGAVSGVDGVAVDRLRRLHEGLGQRRVGVDGAGGLLRGALQPQGHAGLGDEVRRMRPDHVDAEHLVVLCL